MSSPTQLSLAHMRSRGYLAAVTEHWNHFAKIRQDLFGILDLVCVSEKGTVGVQTTSYKNMASRVKKIAENAATPFLRKAGWCLEVHGWRKVKGRWSVRVVDVS